MKTQRTDQKRTVRWLSTVLLFGAILTMMLPAGAWALGTASYTTITNTVTIDYNVGTVAQTPLTDSASFVVDDKVDLAVTTLNGAIVDVSPGETGATMTEVLRFRLDNEGNTTHDFLLSAIDQATGSSYPNPFGSGSLLDSFDADTTNNPVRIYMDSAGQAPTASYTPGTWDGVGSETPVTYIDELAPDNSVTIYIVIDIPAGQADGDMSVYGLLAQVAVGGAAGSQGAAIGTDDSGSADTAGVDIVFGDDVGADDPDQTNPDGFNSSRSVFRIASATLTASKTSQVVYDTVNTTNNPKAIPGARVQYTITVNNAGGTAASNVVITDPIVSDVTFYSGSASATNNDGSVTPAIEYSADGTTWSSTETSTVNYIRVTHSSIRANDTVTDGQGTLVFQVTIN